MHEICSNMQYQICKKYAQICTKKYACPKCAKICQNNICTYMQKTTCIKMQKICINTQNRTFINIPFQKMHKNALHMQSNADICYICLNVNQSKYAIICKLKYAEIWPKYAKICSGPRSMSPLHLYAFICIYMQ